MANNNHKKRRRWMVAGVALVVLIGCGLGISAALRPNRQIDASKLAAVERGDLARSVVATGKIEPLAKVDVKSKASGIVEKIFADYGDRVKQGQVLVELDKEQLRAQVAEARANLQAAEAAVQSAQATFERNVVDAQGPDLPFLKSTAERDRKLAAEGLISASLLDEGEKAYQMALNKQLSAQRNVAEAAPRLPAQRPRWPKCKRPSITPRRSCAIPRLSALWMDWCCPGTWKWAMPSVQF